MKYFLIITFSVVLIFFSYKKSIQKTDLYNSASIKSKNINIGVAFKENISFNTINSYMDDNLIITNCLYSALMKFDSNGSVINDLVEKFETDKELTSITFFLKKNIYFHNGDKLTSKDVLFSFNLLKKHKVGTLDDFYSFVKNIEILDELTIKFNFNGSFPQSENYFNFYVLPHSFKNKINLLSSLPIGTGPFSLYHEDNEQIILKKFDSSPCLSSCYDFITFKKYSTKNAVWSAFMRNEIDFYPSLTYKQYQQIVNSKWCTTKIFPELRYFLIILNPTSPKLADKNIRQAICTGINKNEIIKKVFNNLALPISSPVILQKSIPLSNPLQQSYNPYSSINILKNAGLIDIEDNDKITRIDPDFTLNLLISKSVLEYKKIAKIIKLELKKIGIELNIHISKDINDYQTRITNKNFDLLLDTKPAYISNPMFFIYWIKGIGEPAYTLSNQEDYIKNYEKLTKQNNKNDEITILKKLCSLINSENNYIFLCYPIKYYAFNNKLDISGINFASYFLYDDLFKLKPKGRKNENPNY